VDALLPFVKELSAAVEHGKEFPAAWQAAAEVAVASAEATAGLSPRLGRARPLAEKSIGTPDAGATSLALLVTGLADLRAAALIK
jgi:hypothetical protein